MSHNEFLKRMKRISRLILEVHQAENTEFFNVSKESAGLLKTVEIDLGLARDHMGDDV